MAQKPLSFEERIARLKNTAATPPGHVPPPPQPPLPPQRHSNGPSKARILKICGSLFFVLAAVSFIVLSTSERAFIAMYEWSAKLELDGNKIATISNRIDDAGGDLATKLAVRQAQARINSGELTETEVKQHQSVINSYQGKSMADIVRSNMTPMLVMQAKSAGQPQLADEVQAKMDACSSLNCVHVVEAQFLQQLRTATGE